MTRETKQDEYGLDLSNSKETDNYLTFCVRPVNLKWYDTTRHNSYV